MNTYEQILEIEEDLPPIINLSLDNFTRTMKDKCTADEYWLHDIYKFILVCDIKTALSNDLITESLANRLIRKYVL